MTSLLISPIDVGGYKGVRLTSKEGTLVRNLAVVVAEDGNVKAAEAFAEIDDLSLIQDHSIDDSGRFVSWIWPVLGGELNDPVLKQLNVRDSNQVMSWSSQFPQIVARHLPEIDQEAVALLRASAEPRLHLLRYYSGKDEKAENRKRHGAIYPVFSDVLASGLRTKRVIDSKEGSLPEAVCKALSTPVSTVTAPYLKRFAQYRSFPPGCDRAAVIAFAVNVPPDWMPKGEVEWVAFCQLATAVMLDLKPPSDMLPPMIKAMGGKWSDTVTRIMNAAYPPEMQGDVIEAPTEDGQLLLAGPQGQLRNAELVAHNPLEVRRPEPFDGIRASLSGVRDMISVFTDNVVLPLAAFGNSDNKVFLSSEIRKIAAEASYRILFTNRNVQDIADLGRRFHQEYHTIIEGPETLQQERKRFIAQQVDGDWPGLSQKRQAPNDLWLVPETSLNGLRQVSAELDHCVGRGSYDVSAERCDTHIVSVKYVDPNGQLKCLSTIQLDGIKSAQGPFSVVQHRAYANSAPNSDAEAAARWYVDSLKSGQLETNWEQIKVFKDVDLRDVDAVELGCKYDWREPDFVFAATVPWHPFLSKPYKGLTFEDFIQTPTISSIADNFAPDIMRMQR